MIEEFGTVEKTIDSFAFVNVERGSMCGNCPSKGLCHPFGGDDKNFQVKALNSIDAKEGDKVKIVIGNRNFLKASFIVYGIPILFLIIFSILGKIFFEKDILSFLAGFSGMILSYFFIKSYDKRNKDKFFPEIVEIVEKNESCCHQ